MCFRNYSAIDRVDRCAVCSTDADDVMTQGSLSNDDELIHASSDRVKCGTFCVSGTPKPGLGGTRA